MSAVSLAAIGWVGDDPVGNRLRWSWPSDATAGAEHILPNTMLVERAPLHAGPDERAIEQYGPAGAVPPFMWNNLGDVSLFGALSVSHSLGSPVQAVRFVYNGKPARVHAFSGVNDVATQQVFDGQWVVLHAAAIDLLVVTAASCELRMLETCDLYAPPLPLSFEVIAEIDARATATAQFADAATRYPAAPTLNAGEWAGLQELWSAAWAEAPGAAGPQGAPNAWQALQIVLGVRWEHSVFCGLAFVDGPNDAPPALDAWGDLLAAPTSVAYRVRDADGLLDPSNIVYVLGGLAPDLAVVPPPAIEDGAVRLGGSGAIQASWDIAWKSSDPGIVGVELRESIDITGASTTSVYDARGRHHTDPPGAGFTHREEQVGSHHVAVAAGARAQDGFDRVGPWGPTSPLTPLRIDHHPQPPGLRSATNDGSTAILNQAPPANWAPDALVAAAGGTVRIYRRIAEPRRLSAKVLEAIPDKARIAVKLDGPAPPDPAAFSAGAVTIGALKGTVSWIAWPVVMVEVPHAPGQAVATVTKGTTAHLAQSLTHPALFVQAQEQPAAGLPAAITFPDPLAAPVTAQLIEYRAQVAFAGQAGPIGPAVQALRLPAIPNVPPPFTVTTLGVDFYHRTVVQLELTNPTEDPLEVWWADGNVATAAFSHAAVPGDAGVRRAEGGRIVFDTLSLPTPNKVARTVTIGVQAVNAADGRSAFATVAHTLPVP